MKMVLKAALLVALVLMAVTASAQTPQPEGWKFSSLTVSAGEDALSSGITGSVWLDNEKKRTTLNALVQQEQGWFMYGRKFKLGRVKGNIAGSIGHFKGSPFIGPILTMEAPLGKVAGQAVSVSTVQWPALNAWEPDKWKNDGVKNPEPLYFGFFTSYQVNIGPVGLVCSWLNYLDDPWNTLPGVSYTQKIRDDFSVTGSVTRNTTDKKWMFYVGATWNPPS